jgi:hypothetical protein
MTEAFPWDTAPRYLLRDRDASYGHTFRDRVEAMAIKEVVTAARLPWQNPYVERVIGSIRRESWAVPARQMLAWYSWRAPEPVRKALHEYWV